jgi:hypothetical protein
MQCNTSLDFVKGNVVCHDIMNGVTLNSMGRHPREWESKENLRLKDPLGSSVARAMQVEPPCHQSREDCPFMQSHRLQKTQNCDA